MNTCVACAKRKPCLLFTVHDSTGAGGLGEARIIICAECAKDPINQQTIITALLEEIAET